MPSVRLCAFALFNYKTQFSTKNLIMQMCQTDLKHTAPGERGGADGSGELFVIFKDLAHRADLL